VETLILVGKWLAGIVATLFVAAVIGVSKFIFGSLEEAHKKLANVYDKGETIALVDSKIIPLKDSLDQHKQATEKLIAATDRLTETISQLNTRITVVETKIEK
jgi:hypothetical protein